MQKTIILDEYEQSIEKDIDSYQSVSAIEKNKIENIINRENEKKSISLRLRKYDLDKLKERAEQEGIPYQTLLSSIIHKFITDQFIDRRSLLKGMQLLKEGNMDIHNRKIQEGAG